LVGWLGFNGTVSTGSYIVPQKNDNLVEWLILVKVNIITLKAMISVKAGSLTRIVISSYPVQAVHTICTYNTPAMKNAGFFY